MDRRRSEKRKIVDSPTLNVSKLECPVCLQIPRANIFQCVNGHSICDSCSTKVTVCPSCQSPGLTVRNLVVESLLDDIQFKCSWSLHGCEKTMMRSELSTHEDECDKNPDIVKFCSKFPEARNCPFQFTSSWLSEPKNCTNFKNHVQKCLSIVHFIHLQYGKPFALLQCFKDIVFAKKFNPKRLAHHSYSPIFFRLPSQIKGKVELLVLFLLVKVDALGNQKMSFAFVQLTPPETSQMIVKLKIVGKPSSGMISQYGQNSLPVLSWSQKPMPFNKFMEMVEKPPDNPGTDLSFPFSLPVSLLSDYYSSRDKEDLCVEYTVDLTS